jgi:hypothetical protein
VATVALGLVGLFDLWFDFRKLNIPINLKEEGV